MKRLFGLFAASLYLATMPVKAQIEEITLTDGSKIKVDRSIFPDFDPNKEATPAPKEYSQRRKARAHGRVKKAELPPYVFNQKSKYFPPVFNQDGGSCGSAQAIGYMFTHEINSVRDADASLPENQYPSHFTWMQAYQSSTTEDIVKCVGIPNVTTYGGRTYSRLFGSQTHDDPDYGWMQGYDKWYSAMWNRVANNFSMEHKTNTPEGRQELKEWLYNHSGDNSYYCGGVAGIGVAAYGTWDKIPTSTTNKEIGVTGKSYVKAWGDVFNHALTVVGYDDRIEFDLDGDGKVGETEEDEVGAWIICNSWGDGWENEGFIYCPYKYSYAVGTDQSPWSPSVYEIRRDYRPLRTIKIQMEYSRRSEILLCAGVSEDVNATKPETTINFEHFRYAGNAKGVSPAPEVPMLGRWADGMHYEPMELGYDLTDLSACCDRTKPLKYFFIVKSKTDAIGEGKILKASIMNYEVESEGLEIPFPSENVTIQNNGGETLISVIVPGEQFYAPLNLQLTDGVLEWEEPQPSSLEMIGYNVYEGNTLVVSLPKTQTSYTPETAGTSPYTVRAVYRTGLYEQESEASNAVSMCLPDHQVNTYLNLKQSGMTINNAVTEPMNEATMEFIMKINSKKSYIQQIGPGWGKFLFHIDNNGGLYAGWNTGNNERMVIASTFSINRWYHIAITIKDNVMTAYVNGVRKGQIKCPTYSGLTAFGDLKFGHGSSDNYWDGCIDEFRFWGVARTQAEIKASMWSRVTDPSLQKNLLLYLPMDTIDVKGETCMHEWVSGKHAKLQDTGTHEVKEGEIIHTGANTPPTLDFTVDQNGYLRGIPFQLSGSAPVYATTWKWEAPNAKVKTLSGPSPTFLFEESGTYPITVTTTFSTGDQLTVTKDVVIKEGNAPVAAFDISAEEVAAGDKFNFINRSQGEGCTYIWSLPGAEEEKVSTTNASVLYPTTGTFTVTLTATNQFGSSSTSKTVRVKESAPSPRFDLSKTTILLGDTLQLNDMSRYSPLTWSWELSNGSRIFTTEEQKPYIVPVAPGIYNITLEVTNEYGRNTTTVNKMLTVSNADPKTCLNFTGSEHLEIPSPLNKDQKTLTIDLWMRPTAYEGCMSFRSNDGVFYTTCNSNGMVSFYLSNRHTSSTAGYIILNEWHHYAIVYNAGSVRYYRDGVIYSTSSNTVSGRLPALSDKLIFGQDDANFKGQVDELRLWNIALSADQVGSNLVNTPIADVAKEETENGLVLYYDFNQNGGDVQDRTSNARNAKRVGFGPDGDAWNSALGVFTLDLECPSRGDVSSVYLTNYKNPFITATGTVNPNNSSRFLKLAMRTSRSKWQEMNAVVKGNITTGAHIDTEHNKNITIETQWSGFSDNLKDYRLWQTFTLPAGKYTFVCNMGEGDPKESFLVVNEGSKLLGNSEFKEKSIGWCKITDGEIHFNLTEDTPVSMGILVNLEGQQSFNIESFRLNGQPVYKLEPVIPSGIQSPTINYTETNYSSAIYDLNGRRVIRPTKGIYIRNGKKVVY